MQLIVSGFNGFNQWPLEDKIIQNFQHINLYACLQINDTIKDFSYSIDWSYNVFSVNGDVYLSGFIHDKYDKHFKKITHPRGCKFTGTMASNDKYLLLLNKDEQIVWKYNLFQVTEEQQWQKSPDFLRIENNVNTGCEMKDLTINDRECISKIACGTTMNICLTSDGRLFDIPSEIPKDIVEGNIVDVQCGYEHAVLLTDHGKVYTWGGGSRCQLGHGTIDSEDLPKLVEALAGIDIVKIAAGGWHTCAISTFGDLYTWGWNDQGQLGIYSSKASQNLATTHNQENKDSVDNDNRKILYENLFSDNEFFDPIALENTSCLKRSKSEEDDINTATKKLRTDDNTNDNESYNSYAIPRLIDIYDTSYDTVMEYNVIDVSCGSKHTVIILDDGTVLGSGCNKYGQLGFNPKIRNNVQFFTPLTVRGHNKTVLKCGNWTTTLLAVE